MSDFETNGYQPDPNDQPQQESQSAFSDGEVSDPAGARTCQTAPAAQPKPAAQESQTQTNETQIGQNHSGYYHFAGDPNPNPQPEPERYGSYGDPNEGASGAYGNGGYGGQNYGNQNYGGPNYGGQNQYGGYSGNANVPPQNPMSGYNVNPEPPKKKNKKSVSGKMVAVICLICVLAGGIVGGVAAGLIKGSDDKETAAIEESTDSVREETMAGGTETSQQGNDAIHTTTIDVTTNSHDTDMTPQDVYENYVNAVVAISNESTTTNYWGQTSQTASSGSGMIISKDGYILTNNHVVSGAETLTVMTTAGEEYEAAIVGADSENDVALIKVEATEDLPTVSIGDSNGIQVGQQVCAIGNPLGELTNTLTVGYVSALDREITESTGVSINMFQTDCAINSGNSGGPIFDMNGNVIGITTAKPSSSYSSATVEGIGFCIPINDAMDIVNDLLEYGYVRGRAYIGITPRNMDTSIMEFYNLPVGVYVDSVASGSAAEKAGIKEGDMIYKIDGEETQSITDLKAKLKEYKPGDTATLTVYRSETGETLELEITFDEMQSSTAAAEEEEEQQQEDQQQQQQQGTNPFFPFG